jgi:hypothetical protein
MPWLDYGCFCPNPLQFIVYQSLSFGVVNMGY